MVKPTDVPGLIGTNQKKVPFFHKVDMWGTFLLILLLLEFMMVLGALSNNCARTFIPYDMLLHGPVTLNLSATGRDRMICNPHFNAFVGDANLFTDDFKGAEITEAKSEAYLATPAVNESWTELINESNLTKAYFAFRPAEFCELILPNLETGGCMKYADITTNCVDECGTDPNICFWGNISLINLLLLGHTFFIMPGIFVIALMMFDPPPTKFQFIAKPIIVVVCFIISGICAVFCSTMIYITGLKYGDQQAIYDAYPAFSYTTDTVSFSCALLVGLSLLAYSGVYIYLFACTPKYPRHVSRVVARRGFFKQQMRSLYAEADMQPIANF